MIGLIEKQTPISAYQPSQDVIDLTTMVQKDYDEGVRILNRPWIELNDRSIIDDENRGQLMFNAFVDESVEDPNEAWKWRGTRSAARNKGIAMHAQLTGNYLLPMFMAQNENDEMDRDFSEVMRDIAEWMIEQPSSGYKSSFLQIVMSMITSPITYMGAEWCEVMQEIKVRKEKGSFETKEIIDEVLSGFQAPIWSCSQILFTNAYERNIQKQRCIIKRRWVEKQELEARYGEHENWGLVQEGKRSIYNAEDGLFYEVKDDDHPNLVAEETWLNRRDDTEVCFIGGAYFGETDVDNNPVKHRDTNNAPKYNVIPFGYHRIGHHFMPYKSLMNALAWDEQRLNAMDEILMNRSLLEVDMPVAISGTDKVDSEVIFPKSIVAFEDKDTKITPLLPPANLAAGFNQMVNIEKSMSEGSLSETLAGQLPEASQKAYSVAQARADSKKTIGAVGKSLAESMVQYGDLMKDIILHNVTVPEVQELTGGRMKLKYRTFMLPEKQSKAGYGSKAIKFDEGLIGLELTDKEKKQKEYQLLEKSGYPKKKDVIYLVNPEMFSKFKYLTKVDVEEMFPRNQEYWQPILSQLYAQLANNPFVDFEGLTRKLLLAYFNSEGEDLLKKQEMVPGVPLEEGQGVQAPQNQFGQQVQNQLLSSATTGAKVIQ